MLRSQRNENELDKGLPSQGFNVSEEARQKSQTEM
jgi:hypothetical protein